MCAETEKVHRFRLGLIMTTETQDLFRLRIGKLHYVSSFV